jgi:hypothetical protein
MKGKNRLDTPPLLGKWSNLYWAVMLNLVLWLTVFYLFRKVFE